jgi:uncharacterized protein YdhG (YjbR/CyaY superfamily)
MKPGSTAPATIDDYIATFPSDLQGVLQDVRTTIRKAAPDAVEAMKYGIPTFVQGENLVHFGGFKTHVGFYPSPSGIAAFSKELSAYEGAKGSVRFPLGQRMPLPLIARIVKFRVREVEEKAAKQASSKTVKRGAKKA